MIGEKYTLGECRNRIIKLLERYSSNGEPNSCGELLDIENRLVTSLNIHIRKLWYEFSKIKKQYEFSFFRPECAFDYGSMTLGSDEIFTKYFDGKNPGFHIVVGGTGRLIFYTSSMDSHIYTINTEPGKYTVLSGAVDNPDGEDCHFLLSAEPFVNVKSFVIYNGVNGYCGEGELLTGKDTVCARLPDDCSEIISLTKVGTDEEFSEICTTDDEKGVLTLPYAKSEGDFVLEYIPYPSLFEEEAGDSATIMMQPVLFDALCYMCAADLCPTNDSEAYSKLTYKYREILENIYDRHRPGKIKNKFYGILHSGRKFSVTHGK